MNLIMRILVDIFLIFGGTFYWILSSSEMKEGRTLEAIYYLLNLIIIYMIFGFTLL